MKVLHVVASLDSRMGGLPRAVIGLAAAQSRLGTQVTVATSGAAPSDAMLREWGADSDGSPELCSLAGRWSPFPSTSLVRFLDSTDADWLQVHGLWEPLLHACMRWARSRSVPYGITPHSMLHPWHDRHHRVAKACLKHGMGVQSLWRQCTRLHALTEEEAARWESVVGAPERIAVIPNGIHPRMQELVQDETLPDPLPDAPFLLFLGRLHPQKQPEVLLEAFGGFSQTFQEHHLVLAGPDAGLLQRLKRQAAELGVGDRVHFPGMLEGGHKWEALRRCAAFCLPSRAEGFSLSVLEACLAGAPCFLTPECGFPELIQAGGAVEVSGTSLDIQATLESFLADGERSRRMGMTAQKLVLDEYSWKSIAEHFNRMILSAKETDPVSGSKPRGAAKDLRPPHES